MRWRITDAKDYLQAKDYIDTAVIPLINIKVGAHFKITAEKGEFTQLLSDELERQLKGRVYLLPPYTYVDRNEKTVQGLKDLREELISEFPHVVLLTSDENWNSEDALGKIIVTSSVPLEHLNDSLKRKILDERTAEILNVLLQLWSTS
ncbi:YpiF family protein [Bacillus inaquosorum]|uniref:YpiF family protein n=1 Tax=Bacillus inaquosorum TaxID=483913 RepID=UPI00227F98A4|nr:YpiF family protein [Bacillus inaquosorum]MCY7944109.1 YpiF family protein [Bacillus inaquosorum]MCY7952530.1 YpiF family protein [Bacillus inaquosorum]MCY7985424.1 YpiF family protein [Bacillus inaquosorum]MCY8247063.1 YpiF family protein [Bacillus inaquosorum]MCY8248882.1 YpiF family protein [Bacillus inaquosorum]